MLQEWLRNSALTGQAGFFSRAKQILKRDLNENEAKAALLTAVQHGRASYVRVLLENHVDPNLSDDNKVTALHFAARYGQCNCIEELVKGGADINVVNLENWTPLHIAIKQCQEGAVKKLIELGCDINAAGGMKWNIVFRALGALFIRMPFCLPTGLLSPGMGKEL